MGATVAPNGHWMLYRTKSAMVVSVHAATWELDAPTTERKLPENNTDGQWTSYCMRRGIAVPWGSDSTRFQSMAEKERRTVNASRWKPGSSGARLTQPPVTQWARVARVSRCAVGKDEKRGKGKGRRRAAGARVFDRQSQHAGEDEGTGREMRAETGLR